VRHQAAAPPTTRTHTSRTHQQPELPGHAPLSTHRARRTGRKARRWGAGRILVCLMLLGGARTTPGIAEVSCHVASIRSLLCVLRLPHGQTANAARQVVGRRTPQHTTETGARGVWRRSGGGRAAAMRGYSVHPSGSSRRRGSDAAAAASQLLPSYRRRCTPHPQNFTKRQGATASTKCAARTPRNTTRHTTRTRTRARTAFLSTAGGACTTAALMASAVAGGCGAVATTATSAQAAHRHCACVYRPRRRGCARCQARATATRPQLQQPVRVL